MDRKTSFDIVLKIAERCNLACSYCYYFYQEFDNAKSPPIIRRDVVDRLAIFLKDAARSTTIDHFNLVFHGGEPLLIKKHYFDEICTYLRAELDGVAALNFAVQTNGVLIDDEWIELFAKHQVNVGISIDGMQADHDRLRPDKRGRGSYDRAVAGLRLLQGAVADGRLRTAGVLGVVPAHGSGRAFLKHLIDDLKVSSPGLNFPRGGWDSGEAREWASDVEARRELVVTWLREHLHPDFSYISHFADIFFGMMSDAGAEKLDWKLSRRHHIMTVSSSGEMMIDDNLLGLDSELSHAPMTIFDSRFIDFLAGPAWQQLQRAVDTVPPACADCTWYRTCRSGNLYNRYSKAQRFLEHSVLCDSIQVMAEEMALHLLALKRTNVEELIERLKSKPTVTAKSALCDLLGYDLLLESSEQEYAS